MRKFFPVVLTAILLAGVLTDPYTYARTGSDAILPAPLWQSAFAILDVGVLLALVVLAIRHRLRGAMVLAVCETIFYLVGNAALYLRDGRERFVHGFGAESNLTEHVTVLIVRLVLVAYLFVVSWKDFPGESVRPAA
jgi:hypothetical protein